MSLEENLDTILEEAKETGSFVLRPEQKEMAIHAFNALAPFHGPGFKPVDSYEEVCAALSKLEREMEKEFYECSDVAHIYNIEAWVFFVISALIWVFGTQRGSPIRKINFSSTNIALYLASTVFFAAKHDLFCGVLHSSAHPERDDLLISRFVVYSIFLVAVVIMVSIRASEDAISIITHVTLALVSSSFWLFTTITTGELQEFWMYNSAIYAGLLCFHMLMSNRSYECSDPIYATRLIHTVIIYILCFYGATLLGPWFFDKIDLVQQEWFLSIVDGVLVGFIFISIVHFGGARRIEGEFAKTSPGDLMAMSPTERERFILTQHLQDA